jgi:TatD DNase family protein
MQWIDSHCHLDAFEFSGDLVKVRTEAATQGVTHCVIPAVEVANFEAVRSIAHQFNDSYCLGIHPLYVPQASDEDLLTLDTHLALYRDDPRLVAVGEIGLDYFVSQLTQSPLREKHEHFYRAQLKLARKYDLPVMLHVRRSADMLLKHLRDFAVGTPWHGIAHAFNGSAVQAQEFLKLGFKLGFGGALTFERALQLRSLASSLPLTALVLETDAPDIPPHWLYATAEQRAQGAPQGRNTPGQLPRIAAEVAQLRGISLQELAVATRANTCEALPKIAALLA